MDLHDHGSVSGPLPTVSRLRRVSRVVVSELVAVKPAPGALRGAVRMGWVNLVVLAALVVLGRIDLAVYATFGAFTCVYGGSRPVPGRWRTQATMAAVLVSSVVLGCVVALSPSRSLLAIPVTAAATALAAVAALRGRWLPPGPFFVAFAVATCASIPIPADRVGPSVVVAAVTAALGVLAGVVEEHAFPVVAPGPVSVAPGPGPQRFAARGAVAVLASGVTSTAVGIGYPYWAMPASVAVMAGPTVPHQLARGVQRGVGTAVGLVPALVLLQLQVPLWAVPLVVAGLQALVQLFIVRNYALAMVFVTPLALFVPQFAHPMPVGELLSDRLLETLIGVGVGCLVVVLLRERG